ncbi:SGNH/GDSL hydrolase family protein [Klugiella xanthotipulae]|nr:SGNH/GDSL hydrolase family protein [Klugiella xanthotipulae]
MSELRYVALGDSFTEGVGDDQADGRVRGWADLVAEGLAEAEGGPIRYANLAIRGRLLGPIIDEQLEPALALGPTLVTFNGGGNDILRPRADLPALIARTEKVFRRVHESGAQLIVLSGANPTRGLPLREAIQAKGDQLNAIVRDLAADLGVPFADNWSDEELIGAQYWSTDRLHLNATGHHRVAARVLDAMGYAAPQRWVVTAPAPERAPGFRDNAAYYRQHVMPWIKRRLTGRSSGDGRVAKYAEWVEIGPRG